MIITIIGELYCFQKNKTLKINSKEFNFKYIEDISYSYSRYSESNLLIILLIMVRSTL